MTNTAAMNSNIIGMPVYPVLNFQSLYVPEAAIQELKIRKQKKAGGFFNFFRKKKNR